MTVEWQGIPKDVADKAELRRLVSEDGLLYAVVLRRVVRSLLDSEAAALARTDAAERREKVLRAAMRRFFSLPNVVNRVGPWKDINDAVQCLIAALKHDSPHEPE